MMLQNEVVIILDAFMIRTLEVLNIIHRAAIRSPVSGDAIQIKLDSRAKFGYYYHHNMWL
jgi:hypothetical protein